MTHFLVSTQEWNGILFILTHQRQSVWSGSAPIRPCGLLSRHHPYSCERITRSAVTETIVYGFIVKAEESRNKSYGKPSQSMVVPRTAGTQKPRAFSTSDGFLFEHHNHIFCILSCLCSLFVAVSVLAIMIKLSKNKMRKFLQYELVRWWGVIVY